MNVVKEIQRLNAREAALNINSISGSWHDQFKDSAHVFVGGLPYELTEGDVICVMSQFGEIASINLVRDRDTGKSKGYAFIKYVDQRSTVLAVDNMNGCQIKGRTLRVDHVQNYKVPKKLDEDGNEIEQDEDMLNNAMPKAIEQESASESESDESEVDDTGIDPDDPMREYLLKKLKKKAKKAKRKAEKESRAEKKAERRARREEKKARKEQGTKSNDIEGTGGVDAGNGKTDKTDKTDKVDKTDKTDETDKTDSRKMPEDQKEEGMSKDTTTTSTGNGTTPTMKSTRSDGDDRVESRTNRVGRSRSPPPRRRSPSPRRRSPSPRRRSPSLHRRSRSRSPYGKRSYGSTRSYGRSRSPVRRRRSTSRSPSPTRTDRTRNERRGRSRSRSRSRSFSPRRRSAERDYYRDRRDRRSRRSSRSRSRSRSPYRKDSSALNRRDDGSRERGQYRSRR